MGRPGKFTLEADELILRMRDDNATFAEITVSVQALGLDVIESGVRHRWRWITMTPAQRNKRRQTLNARRRKGRSGFVEQKRPRSEFNHESFLVVTSARPSAKLLADRDRRSRLEPRSLTAALLGDPLPGCSALDRRGYA